MYRTAASFEPRTKGLGLAVAVAVHAAALAAMWSSAPSRPSLSHAVPMLVRLIAPPPVDQPTAPPKPLPAAKRVERAHEAPRLAPSALPSPAVIEAPVVDSPLALAPALPPEPVPKPQAAPQASTTAPGFDAAYLDNPSPPYPAIAKRAGEQGKVVLRVQVDASGRAEAVEIETSSGSPRLDHAARETVRRWRFVPARRGDQAVAASVLVPIIFTLER